MSFTAWWVVIVFRKISVVFKELISWHYAPRIIVASPLSHEVLLHDWYPFDELCHIAFISYCLVICHCKKGEISALVASLKTCIPSGIVWSPYSPCLKKVYIQTWSSLCPHVLYSFLYFVGVRVTKPFTRSIYPGVTQWLTRWCWYFFVWKGMLWGTMLWMGN